MPHHVALAALRPAPDPWHRGVALTTIGGWAGVEGRSVDQWALRSACDCARKAMQTPRLADAASLVEEFLFSDTCQWARGNRVAFTSSFDAMCPEASDHPSSRDSVPDGSFRIYPIETSIASFGCNSDNRSTTQMRAASSAPRSNASEA